MSDSVVQDADANWFVSTPGITGPARLLAADSELRVYQTVRNRAFYERNVCRSFSLIYTLNEIVYLFVLGVLVLRARVPSRYTLIRQAIRDGEAGRLGAAPPGVEL